MTDDVPRKRPVVAINGSHHREVLTDTDYEYVAELQAATLKALRAERNALTILKTRLMNGAVDMGKRYHFDSELGIVRRREKKESAG